MANLIERHREQIRSVLSCFDRVVMQGTLPSICHASAIATLLDSRGRVMTRVRSDYFPVGSFDASVPLFS
jgi:hypothetical protein